MPNCFPREDHHKLLPSNHCKLLPSLIRETCKHWHVSCLKTPAPLSFEEEEALPDNDLDNKHMIILEIRSRAMKAKLPKPKEYLFAESLHWVVSPKTGKLLIARKGERNEVEEEEEEDEDEGDNNDDESEVFYSVKSCFSRCSSEGRWECRDFRGRSIWEEFCHCEGWPFGLCRRALMLPPLPSSPSDSWTWRKRNLVTKNVCANS